MSTLTLSGWSQPADALNRALALPDAASLNYSDYATLEQSFAGLAPYQASAHVIGWSLGGLLALHAIAAGVLKPQRLTLIATPYQFVSGQGFDGGMDPVTFQQFRESYARDAARTSRRFDALIAKGDSEAGRITRALAEYAMPPERERWLPWLDRLGQDSLRGMDLSATPATRLIHGTADAIVPIAQGEMLAQRLPNATLLRWEGTGHAPQLRDSLKLIEQMNA